MRPDDSDPDLDALFDAVRQARPPADLTERVLRDAAGVQDALRASMPVRAPAGRGGFGRLLSALGGWPGLSGVTAAGVFGLALGFAAPDLLDQLSVGGALWGGGGGWAPDLADLAVEFGDV